MRGGFTLVEILVAIAIIGVLAALILVTLDPAELTEKASVAKTEGNLANQVPVTFPFPTTNNSY